MKLHKSINEQRATFSVDTFRPSQSQKNVLLALDDITAAERTATKADVAKNQNEQHAFDALVDLELIEVDEEDKATLTSTGSEVVANIREAEPELAGEEVPMENFKLLKNINATALTEMRGTDGGMQLFTKDDLNFLNNLKNNPKMSVSDNPDLEKKLLALYNGNIPSKIETIVDDVKHYTF